MEATVATEEEIMIEVVPEEEIMIEEGVLEEEGNLRKDRPFKDTNENMNKSYRELKRKGRS